ncbi:MAG TPA: DHHA1 domain-containing protein, partial [Dehalococcoidia bacterium]
KELERGVGAPDRGAADELVAGAAEVGGVRVVVEPASVPDAKALLALSDAVRQRLGEAAVVLGTAVDGRVHLVANVAPEVVECGVKAGEVVRVAAEVVGGGGGGGGVDAAAVVVATTAVVTTVGWTLVVVVGTVVTVVTGIIGVMMTHGTLTVPQAWPLTLFSRPPSSAVAPTATSAAPAIDARRCCVNHASAFLIGFPLRELAGSVTQGLSGALPLRRYSRKS